MVLMNKIIIIGLCVSLITLTFLVGLYENKEEIITTDQDKKIIQQNPTEKEYIYVPLDCVVDTYFYDEKCYEDSIK